MNDGFAWWLLILGLVAGSALTWLLSARLGRRDADVDERERVAEATWIAQTIEQDGGVAPVDLVTEVLDLHAAYLASGTALTPPAIPDPGPATR